MPAAASAPLQSGAVAERLLVILTDGARPDVMSRLADAGEMPNFKHHFVDRGGMRAAASVFPTVSGPAHLPVLTGTHPGRANLPGIRWAERPRGPRGNFLFRTRSYMAPWRALKLERDVPRNVKTLFHHVPGLADVNTWFVRGCPGHARFTRWTKAASFLRSLTTKDWYRSDTHAENAVRKAWDGGFPSVFSVFPAVDELGHRFGPLCDESYEAYRRFDKVLGRLFDDLTRRGTRDGTLVMITSDHGQSATHTHVDIDDLVAAVYPRTLAYPKLWRHLFSAEAAAMVSGNGMANVYLQGERGWHERPDFEDSARRPAALVAALLGQEAIAHVIYRRAPRIIVLAHPQGRVVIDASDLPEDLIEAAHSDARVRISSEGPAGDLLGLAPGDRPAALTRREILAHSRGSAYPDAAWQLVEFFASPRAGDLVVCARPGFDLRSRFEYQPHRGSHGCLDREHMLVPAAVNARWATDDAVTSLDLFPTALAALGLIDPDTTAYAGRAHRLVTT